MLGRSGVAGASYGHTFFWLVLATLGETSDAAETMRRHSLSRATFYRLLKRFEAFGALIERQADGRHVVVNWPDIEAEVKLLASVERLGRLPSAGKPRVTRRKAHDGFAGSPAGRSR